MIALGSPRSKHRLSAILGVDGKPLEVPPVRTAARPELPPQIDASYDAARTTPEHAAYWANADVRDADSANSRNVRHTLIKRSRYEAGSNGYVDGIYSTHANYIVGKRGPRLKVVHANKQFAQEVEVAWRKWAKRVSLRRKLWCMAHAKVQDGEAIGLVRMNPKIKHKVKLDVCLIEAEQCQTPMLPWGETGYIDGIYFDEYGNPEHYDILPYHPGSQRRSFFENKPEQVHARFVLHWFSMMRPGQHRGVPELKSTLNVGASSRRWREATIGAAETAADFSLLLRTQLNPNSDVDTDPIRPLSSLPIQKSTMAALPQGWEPFQMRAEHPNASYRDFLRAQVSEQARPKQMPHNLAACDSSDHSYASGRLDFQPYYMGVDNERSDCDEMVLDKLFEEWYVFAAPVYGWFEICPEVPECSWHWGPHPAIDQSTDAAWKASALSNGTVTISALYDADGEDYEEVLEQMAQDYGVSIDEMRRILCTAIFNGAQQQSSMMAAGHGAGGFDPTAGANSPAGPPDFKSRLADAVRSVVGQADQIAAYSPDQERDDRGRFADEGGSSKSSSSSRKRVSHGKASIASVITNISRSAYDAPALNPKKLTTPIVVRRVGGRTYVVDGRRRVAGIAKFASATGMDMNKIHVPTIEVHDPVLSAAVSSRSKATRDSAIAQIFKESGGSAPRRKLGERVRDVIKTVGKSRAFQAAVSVVKSTAKEIAVDAIAAKVSGKGDFRIGKEFANRLGKNSLSAAGRAVGVSAEKIASRARSFESAAERKSREFERQKKRDEAKASLAARDAERSRKQSARQAKAKAEADLAEARTAKATMRARELTSKVNARQAKADQAEAKRQAVVAKRKSAAEIAAAKARAAQQRARKLELENQAREERLNKLARKK